MPIYEYACASCRHEFEQLVRTMSDVDPVRCPACDGDDVKRRMSVFAARQGESSSGPDMGGGCGDCEYRNGPCGL